MAVEIEISYGTPRGQVGAKPRKLNLNETFEVICNSPGVFEIEFTGQSPLEGGVKKTSAGKNKILKAVKSGRFAFDCTLNGDKLQGPNGGEIEVGGGG
jgi:hypothetical protein